jgi:hypothetical protein
MTEVVSFIVTLIIAAIVYESFKTEPDHKSTNHQYDNSDDKE